ncbi:MAG: WD40 repeat domain-containing protein [Steroidobacteraceae bacterium]
MNAKVRPARLDASWTRDVGDFPTALAWLPGGTGLLVGAASGDVMLLAADGGTPRPIGRHEHGVLAVACRGDGAQLASAGQDGTLAVWRASDGEALWRSAPDQAWVGHLAWQPGGHLLASAAGRGVDLWSAEGERLHRFEGHGGVVSAIAWDGAKRLGAAASGGVWVHGIVGGRFSTEALPWKGAPLTLAFSPNGKVIACGMQDASVHFWRRPGGHHSRMSGYANKVRETGWSANSRWLATGGGASVILWDFGGKGPEGTRPLQLDGHTERITALAFQREGGHLVSGGRDWRLSLWRPGTTTQALDAHLLGAPVAALAWSPDGRRVAVATDNGEVALFTLGA